LQLGVTGFHEELLGEVDLFEIDTFDPILKTAHGTSRLRSVGSKNGMIHLSANHYYFKSDSPLSLDERLQKLIEMSESVDAQGCILKLNASFFESQTLEEGIGPFETLWKSQTKIPLWIDLPQEFPRALKLEPHFSTDPLWHQRRETPYWRIHGWHDTRWVRKYSDETLKSLAKECVRFKPSFLVFAHSQRIMQVLEFSKIYG
jgi:hypothetical protein